MIATVILAVICLALVYALVTERRDHQKAQNLLMTRIQAPQLAPMLAASPDDDETQFVDEAEQERIWAQSNGSEFLSTMEGHNGAA